VGTGLAAAAEHLTKVLPLLRYDGTLSHTGNQEILATASHLSEIVNRLIASSSPTSNELSISSVLDSVRAGLTSCLQRMEDLSKALEAAVTELTVAPVPIRAALQRIMDSHLVSTQVRTAVQAALSRDVHVVDLALPLIDELFTDSINHHDGDTLPMIQRVFGKCITEAHHCELFIHEAQQLADNIDRASKLLCNFQQITAHSKALEDYEKSLRSEELALTRVRLTGLPHLAVFTF
jgi:hypothetical protein